MVDVVPAAPRCESELCQFIREVEESGLVEYKQDFAEGLRSEKSKREFAKDFCSFLNHGEGILIFGVANKSPHSLTPVLANEVLEGSGPAELESLKSRILDARKLIVDSSLSPLRPVETSMVTYEHIFSAAAGGYYVVFGFRQRPSALCYVRMEADDGTTEGWPYGRNTKGVQVPGPEEVIRAVMTRLTISFTLKEGGASQHTRVIFEGLKGLQGFKYRPDGRARQHALVKDMAFVQNATSLTDEEVYAALIQTIAPVSLALFFVEDPERGAPEKLMVLEAIERIDINWQTKELSARTQSRRTISFPPEVRGEYKSRQQWSCLQSCFSEDAFRAAGADVPLLNFSVVQCGVALQPW